MRNSRLLPYETIVQATSGEPEAVNLVLQHYRGYIRYAARISGQADRDAGGRHTEQEISNKVSCFFAPIFSPESHPAALFLKKVPVSFGILKN